MEIPFFWKIALGISALLGGWFLIRRNGILFLFSRRFKGKNVLSPFDLSPTSSNYTLFPKVSVLRFLFAICAIVSLFLFAAWLGNSKIFSGGKDVVFLLDVSKSMDARDTPDRTSRIEFAKSEIERIVRSAPENRYALFVFTTNAYPAIPPTRDIESFILLLSGISSSYIPSENGGTDLVAVLTEFTSETPTVLEKNTFPADTADRLILLVSDGGDDEDTPKIEALRNAVYSEKKHSRFLVVGIGSEEGVPIPLGKDLFGNSLYRTYNGKEVITKRNDEALSRIAEASNGRFVPMSDSFSAFHQEVSKIRSFAEGSEWINDSPVPSKGVSIFLGLFLWFFILSLLLPDRKIRVSLSPSGKKENPNIESIWWKRRQ